MSNRKASVFKGSRPRQARRSAELQSRRAKYPWPCLARTAAYALLVLTLLSGTPNTVQAHLQTSGLHHDGDPPAPPPATTVTPTTAPAPDPADGAASAKTTPPQPSAPEIQAPGRITQVVVHDHGAIVTREVDFSAARGRQIIRITDLPDAMDPGSVRVGGDASLSITSVRYEVTADMAALASRIDALAGHEREINSKLAGVEEQLQVLAKEESLYDSIAEKTAKQASDQVGTGKLDLDEISRLSKFLAEQNAGVLARKRDVVADKDQLTAQQESIEEQIQALRRAGPQKHRSVVVTADVSDGGDPAHALTLSYSVSGVTALVNYTIRTEADESRSTLEFDLLVRQDTGEPWRGVNLRYTNAPLIGPTGPEALSPWVISTPQKSDSSSASDVDADRAAGDIAMDVHQGSNSLRKPPGPLSSGRDELEKVVGRTSQSIDSGRSGSYIPFSTYSLTGIVDVPSDDSAFSRLRIATLAGKPVFRYVAAPRISNDAFLRGTFTNTGRLHLLPGEASLFLGNQYIGKTHLPYVPPNGTADVFMGTDSRLNVQRSIINKYTRSTGLLGDGRETTIQYRIRISNRTGRPVTMEVWDRIPISNTDKIEVSVSEIDPDLSSDEIYRSNYRRQGMLRWDLNVDSHPPGNEQELAYTVSISHKSDVPVPDIPD